MAPLPEPLLEHILKTRLEALEARNAKLEGRRAKKLGDAPGVAPERAADEHEATRRVRGLGGNQGSSTSIGNRRIRCTEHSGWP